MISLLLVQIVLLVCAVLFFLACFGEKRHYEKGLYGAYTVCFFALLLISLTIR